MRPLTDEGKQPAADHSRTRTGLLAGIGAYVSWGFIPLYFRAIAAVPPIQILAHRVFWSFLLLSGIVTLLRGWPAVIAALRSSAARRRLVAATLLIAFNWLVYIHAVNSGQVLQSALGYFLNPLFSVMLGTIILGEQLRRGQVFALVLATLGVLNLAMSTEQFPWIALTLATTFSLYGLIRKTVAVDGLTGVTIETFLLSPIGLAGILFWRANGTGAFGAIDRQVDFLLILSGAVTAFPLLLFAGAARRLRLATLGFLQYVAPTLQFLLAVFAFGEAVTTRQLITFGLIWTAVAIYSAESLQVRRREAAVPVPLDL